MVKRILCFLLIILIFSTHCAFADGNVTDDNYLKKALFFIQNLGIDSDASYNVIKKTTFIAMGMQAYGIYDILEVPSEKLASRTVYAGFLENASNLGFINMPKNGYDDIETDITLIEAIAIAERILGYGYAAEQNGGYPNGYISYVDRIGLLKGLKNINYSSKITEADAVIIIYNMLNSYVMETVTGISAWKISDDTLLFKNHHIVHKTDVVIGIDDMVLLGNVPLGEGYIQFEKGVYRYEGSISPYLLGQTVEFYIKTVDGEAYAFALYNKGKSEILTINPENIIQVEGFDSPDSAFMKKNPKISYYNDNNKITVQSISADITLIYNGVNVFEISNDLFKPPVGEIKLVVNSGKAEICFIDSYDYFEVTNIDFANRIVHDENNLKVIDFYEAVSIKITEKNRDMNFENILIGDTLAVRATYINGQINYRKPIFIEIINKTITGVVIEKMIEDDINKIKIDNKWYKVISNEYDSIVLAKNYQFVLGKKDEVISFLEINTGSSNYESSKYGYLVNAALQGLGQEMQLQIFCDDGKMRVFTVSEDIQFSGEDINGTLYNCKKIKLAVLWDTIIAPGGSIANQLIKYIEKENDNISWLSTAQRQWEDAEYTGYTETGFNENERISNARVWRQYVTENYVVTQNSKVFIVPENTENTDAFTMDYDIAFDTINPADEVIVYDSNLKFQASAVVIKSDSGNQSQKTISEDFYKTKFISVIEKKTWVLDEDNDAVINLKAYHEGAKVNLKAQSNDVADPGTTSWAAIEKKRFGELEQGDIIQYRLDKNGKVTLMHVLHSHDKDNMDYGESIESHPSMKYLSPLFTVYGRVKKYKSSPNIISVSGSDDRKYELSSLRFVYLYHINTGKMEVLSKPPVLYETDYVFILCRRTTPTELVIYRGKE